MKFFFKEKRKISRYSKVAIINYSRITINTSFSCMPMHNELILTSLAYKYEDCMSYLYTYKNEEDKTKSSLSVSRSGWKCSMQ